jgi:hypothetical protein
LTAAGSGAADAENVTNPDGMQYRVPWIQQFLFDKHLKREEIAGNQTGV